MTIYIIHEIEGGNILPEAFKCYEDARSYLNWEVAMLRMQYGSYKISEVIIK